MTTKNVQSVELSHSENQLLKSAFIVALGGMTRNRDMIVEGSLGFTAMFAETELDDLNRLMKRMETHAKATAPSTDASGDGTPPVEPTTADAGAKDTSENGRAVVLTQREADLIGAGLNVASALLREEEQETFLAVQAYAEAAMQLGLDGQSHLRKKLDAQFDLFAPED